MKNENEFKITGELVRVEQFTAKSGKSYPTAIIAIPDDKFPQSAAIKLFGKASALSAPPGSIVRITGVLGGREWNGKVYTEAKGLSVELVKEAERQAELPTAVDDDLSVPF